MSVIKHSFNVHYNLSNDKNDNMFVSPLISICVKANVFTLFIGMIDFDTPESVTYTIMAGQTSVQHKIDIIQNDELEDDETFQLILEAITYRTFVEEAYKSANVTITEVVGK